MIFVSLCYDLLRVNTIFRQFCREAQSSNFPSSQLGSPLLYLPTKDW